MKESVGMCIGEASPSSVEFISEKVPNVGEYVLLEYEGKKVLGMIESLLRGSVSITGDIVSPKTVSEIKALEGNDFYVRGAVKIIGDINDGNRMPRSPPPPGTEVMKADAASLSVVFGDEERNSSGIRLGSLMNHDIPVFVDVNKMVSRHLAILAMTGAGKSNTVAVIADGIMKHKGCVLIFDMHSEYGKSKFSAGSVNIIPTRLNPVSLSVGEIAKLANIRGKAYVQRRYLDAAFKESKKKLRDGETPDSGFFGSMNEYLEECREEEDNKKDRDSILAVEHKLESMMEEYEDIFDFSVSEMTSMIKPSSVNIIDLGLVDEDGADVIVSHVMKNALAKRKSYVRSSDGMEFPLFVVLEEAHILAPKSRHTDSARWISRIAREGRKFGIGLCLVSQRPKTLDPEALSQANNMIVMRLVEPNDQSHVQMASEALSHDLMSQLPSLNKGEAVVIGQMVPVPALVKIDEFSGKLSGGDIDIVSQWKSAEEAGRLLLKTEKKEADELLGGY